MVNGSNIRVSIEIKKYLEELKDEMEGKKKSFDNAIRKLRKEARGY